MIDGAGGRGRGEVVGELRYLSIRLTEYVAALPARSLPPRGRVPWSPDELTTLRGLTHHLGLGERDADRAVVALDTIGALFGRDASSPVIDSVAQREQGWMTQYAAERGIAADTLLRLQHVGDATPPAAPAVVAGAESAWWTRVWARLTGRTA
jgi:hypothetical protein